MSKSQNEFVLSERDAAEIAEAINNFPLGSVNVSQAKVAADHAQNILNFIGSRGRPVEPMRVAPKVSGDEKK